MTTLVFTDNIVGNIVYSYLVKTRGGAKIYRPIEKVDGFLLKTPDGGAGEIYLNELLSKKLKYIEEEVTETRPNTRSYTNKFTTEKGFYKMYIADVGDKNCKTNMKDIGSFNDRKKVRKDDDKCIAYIKIDKPVSRYSTKHGEGRWFVIPTVTISNTPVFDMHNNEKVAEYNAIGYMGCGILGLGMFEFGLDRKRYPKDNNEFKFIENVFSAAHKIDGGTQ
jgi:hypothetical protein